MFEPVDSLTVLKEEQNGASIKNSVQEVLTREDTFNEDHISLFEVSRIYQEIKTNKEKLRKDIENKIRNKLKTLDSNYYVILHDFDYEEVTLIVSVCHLETTKRTKFYFRKSNNNFELFNVKGKKRPSLENIFELVGEEVLTWYDYCYSLKESETQICYNVQSVNSNFNLVISNTCISIYYNKNSITSDFRMLSFHKDNKIYYKCKWDEVKEILKEKEVEFIKKIFVKISDCPKWMHDNLVVARKEQLEERERKLKLQEEEQRKLLIKQKRCEFWKKIFPFIK